jgi:hypothetical protein
MTAPESTAPDRPELPRNVQRAVRGETLPMLGLERALWLLEWFSLGHLVRTATWKFGACQKRIIDRQTETLWRYRAASLLDFYISLWFCAEVLMLGFGSPVSRTALAIVVGYRLGEVTQMFANTVLFDRRRSLRGRYVKHYVVVSVPRSLVHSIVLLIEAIMCFGLLFYAGRSHLTGVTGTRDALDMSMRTMTTIGSSVIPDGSFRLLVSLEPLIGLLFAGTVLARAMNALPPVEDTEQVLERERRGDEDARWIVDIYDQSGQGAAVTTADSTAGRPKDAGGDDEGRSAPV